MMSSRETKDVSRVFLVAMSIGFVMVSFLLYK